jgi:hypothetical protein
LEVGIEVASPDLVDNDFDFVRYYSRLKRTGSSPLPGLATIEVFLGGSDRTLPPQKYFTVDFTYSFLGEGMFFRTVGENNFAGSRVAAVYLAPTAAHQAYTAVSHHIRRRILDGFPRTSGAAGRHRG